MVSGSEAFAGTHQGREAILAYFAGVTGAFDKRFTSREVLVIDGPEEAASLTARDARSAGPVVLVGPGEPA